MHKSNFTVRPLFDISVIYAKYLAYNLWSATEMIIKITLVHDVLTFYILNCKNYLHPSINYNLRTETRYTKIRYMARCFLYFAYRP